MYILFKGVLSYQTKLLLFTFIYEKKFLTLKDLNRIASFIYGRSEARNKPPKGFEEVHIKGPKEKKLPLSGMHARYEINNSYDMLKINIMLV